jgi:peptidyl-prolyl cis-trans isomerase B (cyclophilin B)
MQKAKQGERLMFGCLNGCGVAGTFRFVQLVKPLQERFMNYRWITAACVSLLAFGLCLTAQEAKPKERKQYAEPPKMTIDANKTYTATIETAKGKIVCELYPKEAPNAVNNFVFLSREGFYDGITFHRVIPDFMIQGGDPTGTGRGGPGYKFDDELAPGKFRKHQKGSLSMANAGPNTNGSQFFITHRATDWLDGKHVVFGQVTSGQDVVDKIEQGDVMKTVTIEEK